mgnify:CR=1 FL=1
MNLHNTLSGRVEPFAPAAPPEVRMYVCGPTVYARAHIGNFRTFVATDLLRRALRYKGYQVKEVMNLTDVEDRIIRFAADAGQDLRSFTAPHVVAFEEDMAAIHMEGPEVMPKATEHVPEMVALVEQLGEGLQNAFGCSCGSCRGRGVGQGRRRRRRRRNRGPEDRQDEQQSHGSTHGKLPRTLRGNGRERGSMLEFLVS